MEGGNPKVTAHVTVCPSGFKPDGTAHFDAMHAVLIEKRAEPHFLYDPVTDRLGQYFPLDRSARALSNELNPDLTVKRRTNGSGLVNIQIEFVAWPGPITDKHGVTTQHAVFTDDWKPRTQLPRHDARDPLAGEFRTSGMAGSPRRSSTRSRGPGPTTAGPGGSGTARCPATTTGTRATSTKPPFSRQQTPCLSQHRRMT